MHWLGIAVVAGVGYLWWTGGHSTSNPLTSIQAGFATLTGQPCVGCVQPPRQAPPAPTTNAPTNQNAIPIGVI